MAQALCVPIYCDCGERQVWWAEVPWLEREGLKLAGPIPLTPHRQPPPRNAQNVTGMFNVRCPRCLNSLPVFPLIRTRLAAGAGVLLDVPSEEKGGLLAPPPAGQPLEHGMRLASRDGRRARRARPDTSVQVQATLSFPLTIVDISSVGLCGEHAQQTQVGEVYTLNLPLPTLAAPVRVTAKVVWTSSWRIEQRFGVRVPTYRSGFDFVEVSRQAAGLIESYVVRLAGKAYRDAAGGREASGCR